MSRPQNETICYGDLISLKHVATKRYLSSKYGYSYESGSEQQKVFTVEGSPDKASEWIVLPPFDANEDEETGNEVGFDDKFRLRHVPTGTKLHSHDIQSPVSGQQEVSCFGDEDTSDDNDIWQLVQCNEDDEEGSDYLWHVDQSVALRHVRTEKHLHSHGLKLTGDENEVTAFEYDKDGMWAVSFD